MTLVGANLETLIRKYEGFLFYWSLRLKIILMKMDFLLRHSHATSYTNTKANEGK